MGKNAHFVLKICTNRFRDYTSLPNIAMIEFSNLVLSLLAGADISAVKDVLGHGSITSTEVYAKVALEKKIEAGNLFNNSDAR